MFVGMKKVGVAAFLVLATACTSTTGPDVVANTPDRTVQNNPGYEKGSQEDLEKNAGHRVFFDTNQYALSSNARTTLSRQATWLKQNPGAKILISGNCDERGTREYNLALGARRAQSARAFLISSGVEAARIRTLSNGKDRPLDPRSSQDAWRINRNATTTLVAGAGV
ncbi:MAG: OmpA family protein [Pseudomonadota bacterium]